MDIQIILSVVVIVSSVWVAFDASQIGIRKGLKKGALDMGPAGWFFACLLGWILVFPLYLSRRPELKRLAMEGPDQDGSERFGPPRGRGEKIRCPMCGAVGGLVSSVKFGEELTCSCGYVWKHARAR